FSDSLLDNENATLAGGAGIQAAQLVASNGVDVVITGNCGPNAVRTLSAGGVKVIVGQTGSVNQATEDYKKGILKTTTEPTVSNHYGMGPDTTRVFSPTQSPAMGTGHGAGPGRGMGRGCGRKRGMGRSRNSGKK
ncbi:MAG: NifB/NifX family molybdenum-iron cluster-binding protein, partial [Desulfobacteraceae bacterium]|nr:NifB/NifX family molybdenum-iron cluster-binding protein [Desulfobacteraceae bacterium]